MEQQQQQYRQQPLRLRGQLRLYRLPIPSCSSRENLQTNWLSSAPPAAQRPFEAVHTSMHHRPISCSFSHSCTCRDVVSLLPFSFSLTLSTGAATDVTAAIALRLNRGATIGAPGALPQGGGRSGGADASSDNKSHLLRRVADVFGSTDPEEVAARFASLNARRIAAKEAATMVGRHTHAHTYTNTQTDKRPCPGMAARSPGRMHICMRETGKLRPLQLSVLLATAPAAVVVLPSAAAAVFPSAATAGV
eukprot:GHVU01171594.1.p1 GENE.GHVU01171594.1~~GHVU01171594.1.p1  ORF type:complete len:249 (+),score=29.47 GHVU01171594.1:137-883(+)